VKRIFESKLSLKIASVVIAMALWFFVNSRGVSEITMAVPIEIKNLPDGYEIVKQKINEVDLGLRGHERLIKNIRIKDIRVYIDMSRMKEGWGIYYINKENIRVPPSIEVTKIDPSALKLKVEKTVTRDVPLKSDIKGRPLDGFRIESVSIEPGSVTIEGAESVVRKIKSMRLETVDVSGRHETLRQKVRILKNGKNIRVSENEAVVTVTFREVKK